MNPSLDRGGQGSGTSNRLVIRLCSQLQLLQNDGLSLMTWFPRETGGLVLALVEAAAKGDGTTELRIVV